MSQTFPTPAPQAVTIGGHPYELVAFYFPNKYEDWDKVYQAPFLGNFWLADVTITVAGETATFHTAEAAFQATKWWNLTDKHGRPIRPQFEAAADGNAAFALHDRFAGNPRHDIPAEVQPDLTYAGLQQQGAMDAALASKFADPTLRAGLLATGGAYLLEHNSSTTRDRHWSDNGDGTGDNQLGKTLMALRGSLPGGTGEPTPPQPVKAFTREVLAK